MARLTPGLGAKGSFLLETPFTTEADVEYTVASLRSFAEIRARGNDPLALIYTPVNLDAVAMQKDIDEGAVIVVLATKAGVLKYVPDTYILSYPSMGSIPYSHLIISASLGMIPDSMDTTSLEQVTKSAISDFIGVEPTVFITRGEVSDTIDEARHVQLTISREAAIKNRETDRAENIRLTAALVAANARLVEYEAIIQQLSQQAEATAAAAATPSTDPNPDKPA